MDFSLLSEALTSKSYEKVADICDEHMLQVAAEGVAFQDDWPYAIHLLGHIYAGDINSMRFLWKSMPATLNEGNQKSLLLGKLARSCGCETMGEAQGLVAAFSDLYTKNMFQLLQSAYSTISIQDTALFLGMSEDDATTFVQQQGWAVDPASQMLTVKKRPIVTEQKLDASKLQNLTEYVFHLEH
ncbi:COP9 signalosome complex subunit 8-like [Prunus yedoensis var. nudiflora]|uniref:COP9 signalosome complex subunit 8-like n=1 Tax=Prunus yedoensis var. nudiflora TaxID=2094558 RepID=A0A314XWH6_PRUYE|nr:COP9 signalosome complex subunit 8-like [Prunus yedoensis var. nudiflora]